MDIAILEEQTLLGFTQREIAERLKCSQTNVRYWLKKYGLTTILGPHGKRNLDVYSGVCLDCGPDSQSLDNFYLRENGTPLSFCKTHHNTRTGNNISSRRRAVKMRMVEHLGGVCMRCKFDGMKCQAAMEFHHRDPTQKDFLLSDHPHLKDWDLIVKELNKCDLLCATCHRIVHDEMRMDT
jgi:hypothetical protein